jgi:transcriptional regulator with XRE-family HTH domain
VLRVTANTVARWERGEVPTPAWVSVLLELLSGAATQAEAAGDRAAKLEQHVAALQSEARWLRTKNVALEEKLKQRRQRAPRLPKWATEPRRTAQAEQVYKRLVRTYHPDRSPKHAAVMADINELWQALRRR